MSKVFLSHASEEAALAEDIYHALQRLGHTAILDKKDLLVGDEYNVALRKLVEDADFFVFLISPHSIESGTYALTELKYAEQKWDKKADGVIPVLIEEVDDSLIPSFLRSLTYLNPKGNPTAEVVAEINNRLQVTSRSTGELQAERRTKVEAYFNQELKSRDTWYEIASLRCKRRYALQQSATVLLAAVAIAASGLTPDGILMRFSISAICFAIVLNSALMLLSQDQRNEVRYGLAAERMKRERRLYINFSEPYSGGIGELRAFELFVERIEIVLDDVQSM